MFCRQTVEVWGGVRPMFSCKVDSSLQLAKKVVSNSPGLVDFAIGLVLFFLGGNSNYRRIVINPANQKGFWG